VNTHTSHAPLRLGLVGAGGHGRTIQDAIEATDAVVLRAVFDVDEAAQSNAVGRFGCAGAASYEALLGREDLDAVVLATPNTLHRSQTVAAFEAGLHVLVEKPIANTVADGRVMIEAAEAADRVLMVGHDMRRSRGARATRRLLREGKLGDIVSFEIHFSTDSARRIDDASWRLRPDQCPLLPMMQLGIHGVDLVQYFFEPIERVYASTRSVMTAPQVVDSVVATVQTRDQVHGTLVSNYSSRVTFEYRISGTEGTLQSTGHKLRVWRGNGDDARTPETVEDFSAHSHESYRLQMAAFARAVQGGEVPETDGWTGLQALAVVEALQQSAAVDAPQTVPDVRSPQTA
jgi:predicted dehydrogenase